MSEPKVVAKHPAVMDLEPGSYWWCACGFSAKHPFCDGAHKQHGLAPVRFEVEAPKKVALCQCKATGEGPYCDGTHKEL